MQNQNALFLADWCDAVFLHFQVDAAELGRAVPFPLDLHGGQAYVSLVAFTQRRLRFRRGGRLSAFLSAPVASHPFLNLRTYVRVDGRPGIHFLAEWIPNRIALLVGPRTYGLPYRLGTLDYARVQQQLRGRVTANGESLDYSATITIQPPLRPLLTVRSTTSCSSGTPPTRITVACRGGSRSTTNPGGRPAFPPCSVTTTCYAPQAPGRPTPS